jgi:chromate transporter
MLRRSLVDDEGWVTAARFNRTLATYQALPGPEAHELTIYFGMLARGRVGGLVAGLAFMAPGFILMLALSWIYAGVGIGSPLISAAFAGCQAAVLALVVRGLYHIGSRALADRRLVPVAGASAIASLAALPFVVPLAAGAVSTVLLRRGSRVLAAVVLIALLVIAGVLIAADAGSGMSAAADQGPGRPGGATAGELFVSGLRAGALTFGGAYTAIPFVQEDAVGRDGWMTNQQFLDGLALSGVIPAPLIIFATFVGFVGASFVGALAMTAGVFLPAFAITLLGHGVLERVVADGRFHALLDGVMAAVIGLMVITTLQLGVAALGDPGRVTIFVVALAVLLRWPRGATVPAVIGGAAAAGVMLNAS